MNKKYLDICIPEEIENDPKALHEYLAEQERLQREQDRAEEERIFRETGERVGIVSEWL